MPPVNANIKRFNSHVKRPVINAKRKGNKINIRYPKHPISQASLFILETIKKIIITKGKNAKSRRTGMHNNDDSQKPRLISSLPKTAFKDFSVLILNHLGAREESETIFLYATKSLESKSSCAKHL